MYIFPFYLIFYIFCILNSYDILLKPLIIYFHKPKKLNYNNDIFNKKFIINYNLKAYDRKSIDECFNNMYNAFISNLTYNSIAVLIIATESNDKKI